MASLLSSKLISTSTIFLACLLFPRTPSTVADPLYQECGTTGNYTANSTYESNLKSLLSSLSSNGSATGFYNDTRGQLPDQVFGLVLCRGDTTMATCRSCLDTANVDVQQLCTYSKSAAIWYDDCFLRFSNLDFLSSTDNSAEVYTWNTQNINDPDRFNKLVNQLITTLSRYAAYNTSRRFATGEMNFTVQYPKIYGLTQCTRDLSGDQCYECLQAIMGQMPKYFSGRQAGIVLGVRCNLRYDVDSFYDGKSNIQLGSPLTNGSLLPPSAAVEEGKKMSITGIPIIVITLVLITIVIACLTCIVLWRKRATRKKSWEDIQEITGIESLLFDLATLKDATGNFSSANKIGEGGFGVVYKGILPNGRDVAVKRLSKCLEQGPQQLRNEVLSIGKLRHKNLVTLLGCCLEGREKLLVYEYVPNKSLDTFLFDATRREHFDWQQRYKVIRGIAKGLLYLHEDSRIHFVHRDLKASNVLLDENMNPKISDFGLARPVSEDHSQSRTAKAVGTFGYMAPEYALHGKVSPKSDVFSFGVLVLEILSGRRNNSFYDSQNVENLLSYAWECWTKKKELSLMDPSLGEHGQSQDVLRCMQIGLLCVQEDPRDRPSMLQVVLMLHRHKMKLQPPSHPAFIFGHSSVRLGANGSDISSSGGIQEQSTATSSKIYSSNHVSITDLEPR